MPEGTNDVSRESFASYASNGYDILGLCDFCLSFSADSAKDSRLWLIWAKTGGRRRRHSSCLRQAITVSGRLGRDTPQPPPQPPLLWPPPLPPPVAPASAVAPSIMPASFVGARASKVSTQSFLSLIVNIDTRFKAHISKNLPQSFHWQSPEHSSRKRPAAFCRFRDA